jgi:acyl-coenzyme A synthetase/AMP-(fatty) acid ligase
LRQRIEAIFLPRPLVLVDELPRNSTGKLPRSGLQALYTDRVGHGRG